MTSTIRSIFLGTLIGTIALGGCGGSREGTSITKLSSPSEHGAASGSRAAGATWMLANKLSLGGSVAHHPVIASIASTSCTMAPGSTSSDEGGMPPP